MNRCARVLSLSALMLLAHSAQASISYSTIVNGSDGNRNATSHTTLTQTTSDSSVLFEDSVFGGSAKVKANTNTANLGASSTAYRGSSSDPFASASATVSMTEHFSFTGGAADKLATFQYAIDGSFYAMPRMTMVGQYPMVYPMVTPFGSANVSFSIQLTSDDPSQSPILYNWGRSAGMSGYWTEGFVGSISMPTVGDWTMTTTLSTYAANDASALFGNTAKLYIATPDGVTLLSSTGFMSGATALMPVPEPETITMWLAGGVWLARKSRSLKDRARQIGA